MGRKLRRMRATNEGTDRESKWVSAPDCQRASWPGRRKNLIRSAPIKFGRSSTSSPSCVSARSSATEDLGEIPRIGRGSAARNASVSANGLRQTSIADHQRSRVRRAQHRGRMRWQERERLRAFPRPQHQVHVGARVAARARPGLLSPTQPAIPSAYRRSGRDSPDDMRLSHKGASRQEATARLTGSLANWPTGALTDLDSPAASPGAIAPR